MILSRSSRWWWMCAGVIAFAPLGAAAGELAITVNGLDSTSGAVHYAVYDRPEAFPKRDQRFAKGQAPARGDPVVIVVPNLPPGTYAVAVFHDENGNGEFDQGLFGIPLERYGFSNDARGFFAAPDFEAARFELGQGTRRITITLGR